MPQVAAATQLTPQNWFTSGHVVIVVALPRTTSTARAAAGTLLCPTTVQARPGRQEMLYALPDWVVRICAGPTTPSALIGMIAGTP
jgi:hypothetical protein